MGSLSSYREWGHPLFQKLPLKAQAETFFVHGHTSGTKQKNSHGQTLMSFLLTQTSTSSIERVFFSEDGDCDGAFILSLR